MHPALSQQAHRPWPIPDSPWTWRQSWIDLLFAHWELPVDTVRKLIPDSLEVDTFQGRTFIGVVPFRMEGVTRRPLPALPWLSAFPELNVRLYVRHRDRPGVYFLSLDAGNPIAVWAARTFFHLPYYWSRMHMAGNQEGGFDYGSHRRIGSEKARFQANYRPIGPAFVPDPETLERFLVERYCLYTTDRRGRLLRGEVHHAPWQVRPAEAVIDAVHLLKSHGLSVSGQPHLLYSKGVDVVLWGLKHVEVSH